MEADLALMFSNINFGISTAGLESKLLFFVCFNFLKCSIFLTSGLKICNKKKEIEVILSVGLNVPP